MSPHELPPEQRKTAGNIVAAIMEEAAEKAAAQAAAKQVKGKRHSTIVFILLPILIALVSWNVVRTMNPSEPFDSEDLSDGARMAVYLAADAVIAYRDSTGTLPRGLSVVGLGDLPVTYEVEASGFTVSTSVSGRVVSYRSGQDLRAFVGDLALPRGTR
ncbi:MAG TPA: hypothetical protein VGA22_10005 [Gemmatimonadales bacterium]|jgi:hypothetical protein